MATTEVKVPDIGNYTNVPVIEVLVKAGDTVAKDQGLVTLESDKATMEVPSSIAGVVKEIRVKLGDGCTLASCEPKTATLRNEWFGYSLAIDSEDYEKL